MAALIEVFGYVSVVLHGLQLTAQAVAVGGAAFLVLLALPLAPRLGSDAVHVIAPARQAIALAAGGLAAVVGLRLAIQLAVLVGASDVSLGRALGAGFVTAWGVQIAAGLVIAVAASNWSSRQSRWVLPLGAAAILAGSVATSHAAARMVDTGLLCAATALHQLGAAIWIGGLPCFLFVLSRLRSASAIALVGRRYSFISMAGVAAIAGAGLVFANSYVGSVEALWGTAYGFMTAIKVALFLALICLGASNYRLVERLRGDPSTSTLPLRRFVEVELGIGIAIFFSAASLTSVAPSVDLRDGRLTAAEIAARFFAPEPRLTSPDGAELAVLQERLDREGGAGQTEAAVQPEQIAGPRKAADIALSEFNHNWAGVLLLGLGGAALLERFGVRLGRHWPLLFLALAVFIVLRADPDAWPVGSMGFFESLRDPETVQHRVAAILIIIFGVFEWTVRTGRLRNERAALVFPLICGIGGILLLTHSHAVGGAKEALLIEISHSALALLGIAAGSARWLELRMPGTAQARGAAWVWPLCFIAVGLVLLDYRETSTGFAPDTSHQRSG